VTVWRADGACVSLCAEDGTLGGALNGGKESVCWGLFKRQARAKGGGKTRGDPDMAC